LADLLDARQFLTGVVVPRLARVQVPSHRSGRDLNAKFKG
jgi:hypothetical protein